MILENEVNSLDLLYKKIFIGEIIKITQLCKSEWEQFTKTTFHSQITIEGNIWDFYLSKTQSRYILDINKNGIYVDSIKSDDESYVEDLYDDVQVYTSDDTRLVDVNNVIDDLNSVEDCRNNS